MLDQITPIVLTCNEAPNIGRTLSRLTWAADVVVVDSGSTDDTLRIVKSFPNVRLFVRSFDTHANQWLYAVTATAVATPWILRLDADYQLTRELIEELAQLDSASRVNAYRIAFDYVVFGRKLHSSLYPPNTILLRRGTFAVRDDGHTEIWVVDGPIMDLTAHMLHDDRKNTAFWLHAQSRYMRREVEKITALGDPRWKDRLRLCPPLAPVLIFLYCLFGKGLILNGRAGLFYALQRLVAEAALSLMLLESGLRRNCDSSDTHEQK